MVSQIKELLPADTDDIIDPSVADKILIKLDEIMMEDDEFMQVLTTNTYPRYVYWDQPWYQKTDSITRPVIDSSDNKEIRSDAISSEEVEQIEHNWRKFVKKYRLPDKIICLARWRTPSKNRSSSEDKARRFAVSYLARGLQRTLYHIFRFLLRHYAAPVKQKRFTKDEEKILEILQHHYPQRATVLASKILSREPRGIAKKLNELLNGKHLLPKLKWNLNMMTKFVKLLMSLSGTENMKDLKYKKFSKDVWLKAEEEMGQQYHFLQKYWYTYLHVQLFVKEPVYLRKMRKRIFKKLKKSSYRVWSDIRWKELLHYFPDGFTHLFVYKISQRIVNDKEDRLRIPLPELTDYALQKIKRFKINKRLRKLVLNDKGELEFVKYEQ